MKPFITLCCTLVLSVTLSAQTKSSKAQWFGEASHATENANRSTTLYEFTLDSAEYIFLTDSISLNNGEIWDDPEYHIDLEFPLYIYDSLTPYLVTGDLGAALATYYLSPGMELLHGLAPFSVDVIDRGYLSGTSLSPLSYKVIGEAGSRVMIIEWRNVGSYEEKYELGTLDMYMNYQVWLYEGSNTIEYRYGPSMIDQPSVFYYMEPGPYVGLVAIELVDLIFYAIQTLEGPADSPMLVNHENDYNTFPLTGTPPDGIIYRFNSMTTSVKQPSPEKPILMVPNPAHTTLSLIMEGASAHIIMYDAQGRPVWSDTNYVTNTPISVEHLSPGMYVIQVMSTDGATVLRFIKS